MITDQGQWVGCWFERRGSSDLGAICFWLKNKRPSEWRDVQNINADVGHYIISDKPMSEDEWMKPGPDDREQGCCYRVVTRQRRYSQDVGMIVIEALKRGEEASTNRVVETLYQLAIGVEGRQAGSWSHLLLSEEQAPERVARRTEHQRRRRSLHLSNRPMTEDEWIEARTKTIESKANVATALPQDNGRHSQAVGLIGVF